MDGSKQGYPAVMIYGACGNQICETLESNGAVGLWRMDSGVHEAVRSWSAPLRFIGQRWSDDMSLVVFVCVGRCDIVNVPDFGGQEDMEELETRMEVAGFGAWQPAVRYCVT